MFQLKIFNLILSTFLLACLSACTYLEAQADKQAAIPAPSPIASSAETWPEISPYTGNTTVGILLEQINSPGWKTVWLRGHYQNQQTGDGIYFSTWLDREGHGVLSVSPPIPGASEVAFPASVTAAYAVLSDGSKMFRNDNNQFIEAGKEWNIHSFEQADPLMAFYFGHDLANKPGLEIAGESSLAGEKVLVLKGENVRAWISMDSGAVLGIEDDLQSIRVLDIQYDTPLPGQAFQVIPSGDLRPNLDDRPAPAGFDPAGLALQFNWISLDLYDLSKGNLIDIYQGPYYLGSLEIGSAGFYCDRATDGDHFAYLYQGTGLQPVIHWVDLKNINEIHEVSGYDNISTPIWSPDNTKLAFTANSKDSNPTTRKVYLLEIQTGTIRELGEGSHMPPAWTDDGKYVFSLDGYYSHLQVYSLDENGENYVKDFDGDNWQLSDNSFFISNQEIAQKLPRNSFDFLATCAEATP